jgi:hypothetical protein
LAVQELSNRINKEVVFLGTQEANNKTNKQVACSGIRQASSRRNNRAGFSELQEVNSNRNNPLDCSETQAASSTSLLPNNNLAASSPAYPATKPPINPSTSCPSPIPHLNIIMLIPLRNLKNVNQDHHSSNKAQIDISHLRPTTKFDHLTPSLQSEIEAVEAHILGEISKCAELSAALPSIISSGREVPESYKFVREKSDELSLALENDAADIVLLRDRIVRRDVAEGRLCWKSVDRLKMPSQYQSQHHHHGPGGKETVYGGGGLSGWWNNPIMSTRTRHGAQRNVVSVEDDAEVEVAGGTLVDLLNSRADEMAGMLRERKELLGEIEGFVGNVEGKILMRERELIEGVGGESERERQMKMLRYVFGEVERSLYEVADRVGESRDGLMDLGERSMRARMAF